MIQKLGQIGIPVKDLDRAIEFYEQKLGTWIIWHFLKAMV